MEKEQMPLSELLLEGWLQMSMAIWNERLVTAMTFNESMVCNLLYKQKTQKLKSVTATDLCRSLQISKSQMNAILNNLEKKEMVARIRSEEDRRNVYVELTDTGLPVYEKAHEEILRLPEELIKRLGEEKIRPFAETMKEVAECFSQMITGGEHEKRTL